MSDSKPAPQFTHDCTTCTFHGRGVFTGKPVDWYTCPSISGLRSLLARYGDEGPQYASCVIGSTVEPSRVVLAALAQGLELTATEKDKLLTTLLVMHRQRLGIEFYRECMDPNSDDHNQLGPANWLGLDI